MPRKRSKIYYGGRNEPVSADYYYEDYGTAKSVQSRKRSMAQIQRKKPAKYGVPVPPPINPRYIGTMVKNYNKHANAIVSRSPGISSIYKKGKSICAKAQITCCSQRRK